MLNRPKSLSLSLSLYLEPQDLMNDNMSMSDGPYILVGLCWAICGDGHRARGANLHLSSDAGPPSWSLVCLCPNLSPLSWSLSLAVFVSVSLSLSLCVSLLALICTLNDQDGLR
mmetsp:Transcript_6530/g.11266  ORF Transcript_6530/g.11266 Transcript_6530/m.11266 type:complete len:114 (-) Transcript_6530:411-752(-)